MAKDADEALFRNVVLPHLEEAYTLARWITRNRGDADDVVQEASVRAFRAIRSFSGGNARAWVLTIVRNTAYTWLRKNRSAVFVQVEDIEAVEHTQALAGNSEVETPESLLIAENDAAVKALTKSYFDALEMIKSDQAKAYQIMGADVKQSSEAFGKSAAYLRWQDKDANKKFFTGDFNTFSKEAADLLLEIGIIKAIPDLSKLADPKYVQ